MILKQSPEDFLVEEVTSLSPGQDGPFALYRLEKSNWTTADALAVVRRRWKIDLRRVSFGGLKDRHAHTFQHFTIFRGPQRKLSQQGIAVTFLGQVGEAFTSQHIEANRFRLVLRDLSDAAVTHARAALAEVAQVGLPNYFDDQRFGSVAGHGNFLAKALMLGDHERALRLALTAPYPHDRAAQKKEKATLRGHWNDWSACLKLLAPGQAREVVAFLAEHPGDFAGAFARLRSKPSLYLSAYQSHLWNRMLGRYLRDTLPAPMLVEVPLLLGDFPMPRTLSPEQKETLAQLTLPLPSAKIDLPDDDPRRRYLNQVLVEENLQPAQFKLTGMRDLFFSRGDRPTYCQLAHLQNSVGADENHPGKRKLTLSFDLPRGAYATLVVKRISQTAKK